MNNQCVRLFWRASIGHAILQLPDIDSWHRAVWRRLCFGSKKILLSESVVAGSINFSWNTWPYFVVDNYFTDDLDMYSALFTGWKSLLVGLMRSIDVLMRPGCFWLHIRDFFQAFQGFKEASFAFIIAQDFVSLVIIEAVIVILLQRLMLMCWFQTDSYRLIAHEPNECKVLSLRWIERSLLDFKETDRRSI